MRGQNPPPTDFHMSAKFPQYKRGSSYFGLSSISNLRIRSCKEFFFGHYLELGDIFSLDQVMQNLPSVESYCSLYTLGYVSLVKLGQPMIDLASLGQFSLEIIEKYIVTPIFQCGICERPQMPHYPIYGKKYFQVTRVEFSDENLIEIVNLPQKFEKSSILRWNFSLKFQNSGNEDAHDRVFPYMYYP